MKYVDRLRRMDDLIRRKATGCASDFARKLGISRSMLMENLREMKELGAQICYCTRTCSYYYVNEFNLLIGDTSKNKLKGGAQRTDIEKRNRILGQSNGIGHPANILALPSW